MDRAYTSKNIRMDRKNIHTLHRPALSAIALPTEHPRLQGPGTLTLACAVSEKALALFAPAASRHIGRGTDFISTATASGDGRCGDLVDVVAEEALVALG